MLKSHLRNSIRESGWPMSSSLSKRFNLPSLSMASVQLNVTLFRFPPLQPVPKPGEP